MKKNLYYAFTLVEMVVAITIMGMVLISVMFVYINTTQISLRSDINRMMQENIKSSVEMISEDVRKNGVTGVRSAHGDCGNMPDAEGKYIQGERLCIDGNQYYLAKQILDGTWSLQSNAQCAEIDTTCSLVLSKPADDFVEPITNNMVSIKSLDFYYSDLPVQKVTINMTIQPAIKKGVHGDMAEKTQLVFQTTVSHRPF